MFGEIAGHVRVCDESDAHIMGHVPENLFKERRMKKRIAELLLLDLWLFLRLPRSHHITASPIHKLSLTSRCIS